MQEYDNLNKRCPSCYSKTIYRRWKNCRIKGSKEILWCKKCGLGWQYPLPTPEEVRRYYENYPTYNLHGESEKEIGFEKRIQKINSLMPGKGRMIDVGSGLGYFLKIAKAHRWTVYGIEPQESAANFCKNEFGIEVYKGFIETFDAESNSFDVVTIWDVLEHVHNPLNFLHNCIRLLKPGGLMVISIPNASGWPARIFKGNWRYVMFTHLNYFTIPYICNILNSNGMIIKSTTHTIKAQSLLQGFASWLPMKINTEKILRLGRSNSTELGRKEQGASTSILESHQFSFLFLKTLRYVILKLNLTPISFAIGDLMDIYCRKLDA